MSAGPEMLEFFTGVENELKCRLSFQSGYSQGIFIDQGNLFYGDALLGGGIQDKLHG